MLFIELLLFCFTVTTISVITIFYWEEIFIDVDLDSIYNAYVDPDANTILLLSVLQKHLGYEIPELREASFDDVYDYFRKVFVSYLFF